MMTSIMNNKFVRYIFEKLGLENDDLFKDVFHGSFITLIARLVNAVILLVVNIIVARYFGSVIVGILAIITSILNIASIFSQLGTATSVLRFVPEYATKVSPVSARKVWDRIFNLVLLATPTVALIIFVAGYAWIKLSPPKEITLSTILITTALLPFFTIYKLNIESTRAFFRNGLYAVSHVLPALSNLVIQLIFVLLLPHTETGILSFSVSTVLVFVITFWIIYSILPKKGKEYQETPTASYREIASVSVPMGITSGLQQILSYFDSVMVGSLLSESQAGIYSTAVKLSILTSFIIFSVNAVSASRFSELFYSKRLNELLSLAKKSSTMIFWCSLPILVGLAVFGKPLLNIFGAEFVSGYGVMIVLVLSEFINAIGGSNNTYLNMTGSHKEIRNIMILAVVVNIVLNMILIPSMGLYGAAVSRLISVTLWNGIATVLIYKQTGSWISYLPQIVREKLKI
jgi:O-antigen/teichoic acid export membrane protein